MMANIQYRYEEYARDIGNLIRAVQDGGADYDLIVGIARGGVIPATHLSYVLEIPMITLQWSMSGVQDRRNEVLWGYRNSRKVLLVDDIIDNGDTVHAIHRNYWPMHTACLIYNSINRWNIVPHYTSWTINREETPNWFDFWWEKP